MELKKQISAAFKVDKELIIIFLSVAITSFSFFFISNQRAFLNLFYLPVMEMLSLIFDSVDQETQSHSNRVSTIAVMIEHTMRRTEAEIENFRAAVLVHDLGKLDVSNEILQKMGTLNNDEREHIRNYTVRGAEIIESVGGKVNQICLI